MNIPQLYVDGAAVKLGNRIGKGGEGEVYALSDKPDRAVKFYTAHDGAAREAKIEAIVQMRLAERSALVAFPMAIARDRTGRFMGFLMQLVREHQPLFELYSPAARKQNFPSATYPFLVRAAVNTTRAVAAVHEAGCVIGDINHSGILISTNATAALIDADSFQIIHGAQRYLCRVGVPEYTPPELQGKNLSSVERCANHDAFGLAVVLFQLLAMGRHPFVGRYTKGDMPIEKAIGEFRFAYSLRRAVGLTPPPGACTLDDFSQPIADAFEGAFSKEQKDTRPTAKQWVVLLEEFEKSIIKCRANQLHHYSSNARECPWCRMERTLGVVLFLPTYHDYPPVDIALNSNQPHLAQLWAQIEATQLPSRMQIVPSFPPLTLSPSPEAVKATQHGNLPTMLRAAGIVVALGIALVNPALWMVGLGVAWGGFFLANRCSHDVTGQYRQFISSTDQEWQKALSQREQRCGIERAENLKASLREAKHDLESLKTERDARVALYQSERRNMQRLKFLERFRIRDQKIRGIGPSKLATLTSFGIETAADLDQRDAVLALPGFGPASSQPLFDWQRDCARGFVYNAQVNDIDRAELAKINAEFDKRQRSLIEQITKTAREFLQAAHTSRTMIAAPDPLLSSLHQRRSQLEADCQHIGIVIPPRPTYVPRSSSGQSSAQRQTSAAPTWLSARPRKSAASKTPLCPHCQNTMVRRTARRGSGAGKAFWGCSQYPNCRGTRTI